MSASWRIKITVVGSSYVGKTTFIRGRRDTRREGFNTLRHFGIDFDVVDSFLDNGDICRCATWEIGQRIRIPLFYPSFFKGSAGTLLFFDLSRHQTFEDLDAWIKLIRKINGNIPIILIGTKSDLEPEVNSEEIKEFVRNKGITTYYSTNIYEESKRDCIIKQLVTNIIYSHTSKGGNYEQVEPIRESVQEIVNQLLENYHYPVEVLDQRYQSLNGKEKRLCDRFIEYFSRCPFCKINNHTNYLLNFYFSKKKKDIKLKNQLIELISEDFNKYYSNKIVLGIPCCNCYRTFFNKKPPLH